MSVDLVYQDQYLSTGRTIELVAPQEISVSLESVDLGVSLDLSVSSQVAVELSIVQSLISIDLSVNPLIEQTVVLKNPEPTYTNGILTRVDYDGGLYKTYAYSNGLLTQVDFFDGSKTVRKIIQYANGVWAGTSEVTI